MMSGLLSRYLMNKASSFDLNRMYFAFFRFFSGCDRKYLPLSADLYLPFVA